MSKPHRGLPIVPARIRACPGPLLRTLPVEPCEDRGLPKTPPTLRAQDPARSTVVPREDVGVPRTWVPVSPSLAFNVSPSLTLNNGVAHCVRYGTGRDCGPSGQAAYRAAQTDRSPRQARQRSPPGHSVPSTPLCRSTRQRPAPQLNGLPPLVRRACHRVIKYYAWENNFSEAINDVRRKEVEVLKSQAYWRYVTSGPCSMHQQALRAS